MTRDKSKIEAKQSIPVWVIMGNDYPDGVKLSKESAEKYIKQKKEENERQMKEGTQGKIYWRYYQYEATE